MVLGNKKSTAIAETLVASIFQREIYHWVEFGDGNAVVEAVPGSGKTTVVKQSCKIIYEKWGIRPLAIAFGKRIQLELKLKIGEYAQVQTFNSLGHGLVYKALNFRELNVDKLKYLNICRAIVKDQIDGDWEVQDKLSKELNDLTSFCMKTLTGTKSRENLLKMIDDYNLEITHFDELANYLGKVIKTGSELAKAKGVISFEDQLFLPYLWNLKPTNTYPWILGDEKQDTSTAALELFLKFTGENTRILGVGDSFQAIMGFAGANTDALERLKIATKAISLPLSICYRCPKSHLKLAQKLVPHILPSPTAIEGEIIEVEMKMINGGYDYKELFSHLQGGELIICRKTAPLINLCIKLISNFIPAKLRSEVNVEKSLLDLVDDVSKQPGFRFSEFSYYVELLRKSRESYLLEQGAFKVIANLRDRCEALLSCYQEIKQVSNIKAFKKAVSDLFSESDDGVILSTIHLAKGLEADRVVFLHPEMCPHTWKGQNKEMFQQERNLEYVALTRSRHTLILCYGTSQKKGG